MIRQLFILLLLLVGIKGFGQNNYYEKGRAHFSNGEVKKARKAFSKCSINTDSSLSYHYNLGYYQMQTGAYEMSIKTYGYVLNNDSARQFGYINRNIANNYWLMDNMDSTIHYCLEELNYEYSPYFNTNIGMPQNHYFLGRAYLRKENYPKAIEHLTKSAVSPDKYHKETYYLATAYWKSGKSDIALGLVDSILAIDESACPEQFAVLGGDICVFEEQLDHDRALSYYDKAIDCGWEPRGPYRKLIRVLRRMSVLGSVF